MKKLSFAVLTASALAALAAPAAAQIGFGDAGLEFVDAVKKRDGDKATDMLTQRPASTLVNARDGDGNTALLIAVIKRSDPGSWHLRAIGEFHDCRTVRKLVYPAARQSLM